MKQRTLIGLFAFSIIAVLGVGVVSAFGFGPGFTHDLTPENRTEMQTQMQEMRTAIENNDYESWKSLMEEQITKMQEQITEDNFNQIVAMHQQMQDNHQSCEADGSDCPLMNGDGEKGFGHMQRCPMMHDEDSSE